MSLIFLKRFHLTILIQIIFVFLPVLYSHQTQDLFSQENRQDCIQKLVSGIAVSSDFKTFHLGMISIFDEERKENGLCRD